MTLIVGVNLTPLRQEKQAKHRTNGMSNCHVVHGAARRSCPFAPETGGRCRPKTKRHREHACAAPHRGNRVAVHRMHHGPERARTVCAELDARHAPTVCLLRSAGI
jgi:hypothetical protein